jgi:WD40 repeat protein
MTPPMAVRVIPLLLAFGLGACAPTLSKPPTNPPPASGPFRTVTGEATHPVCGPPQRAAAQGASPRCVVPFGRSATAVGTSPNGSLLLISLMDVDPTVWRLPALTYVRHLAAPPEEPSAGAHGEEEAPAAFAIAADDATALAAVGDRLVRYELASGRALGTIPGPAGMGMIDDVAWSADGRRLLIANAGDGKVRLLDATSGKVLRVLPVDGRAVELAFDAEARRAAVGTEVGGIALVDLEHPAAKPRLLTPSTQEITGLRFVGSTLVTAARDGHIRVFDAASGKRLTDAAVAPNVTKLAVSADGRRAAAADDQHVVRVLSLPDAVVRATLGWHRASITALGWSGSTLLVTDNDGELAAWDVVPK